MANLFGKLFGAKKNQEKSEKDQPTESTQKQKKEAYYLEPDEAKTLGDMEKIRQSMPEKTSTDKSEQKETKSTKTASTERRRADSSMDEFRNMAKNLKKD